MPGGERNGFIICLERTKKWCQANAGSDYTDTTGKTSGRWSRVHMGFPEHAYTTLN